MSASLPSRLSLALLAAAAGCGETFVSVSTDGRIEVAVSTTGTDPDADGYIVLVDGGSARIVASGGSVLLDSLSQGRHRVLLGGLAENCRVDGSNPREVVVGADGRAEVSFDVRCQRPTRGGVTVEVRTAGSEADTDGYSLAVAGAPIREIGPSADETFTGLAPAVHLITLKDVDPPCVVTGGNPQPFTIVAGRTPRLHLEVVCGAGLP